MKTKYMDSELLEAMGMMLNEDSTVYGANGHYSVGAYYDFYEDWQAASGTSAAQAYYECDGLDERLKKSLWLINI